MLDVFEDGDLEVLRGLKELIDNNALVVLDAGTQRTPLCDEEESVVLRAAALKLRPMGFEGAARVAVLAASQSAVSRFARALSALDGFVSEASPPQPAGSGGLGTIGMLRVGGIEVELFALPIDPGLRPLWGAFLSHARVAIWLSDEPPDVHAREQFKMLRLEVVMVSSGWEHPQGAAATLRAMLTSATRPNVQSSY